MKRKFDIYITDQKDLLNYAKPLMLSNTTFI